MFSFKNPTFSLIFLLIYCINNGTPIRTKDKMYENIQAFNACFRRLNATHQVGCSSKRGGSTGVIHFCKNQTDLDFILKNGTAPPYIIVLPTDLFHSNNIAKLKSPKISGVLLYTTKVESFSHDQYCPNAQSNVPQTCKKWNPYGTSLLLQDIPFPIFILEDYDRLNFTLKCFEKYNNYEFSTQRDRTLCSLELRSFMYATSDSRTCIRRSNMLTNLNPVKFCDPLGDKNIWASLFPLVGGDNLTEPIRDFRYIIVAARLDSASLFDKSPGAITPITSLVTLLITAKYLKTMLPTSDNFKTNILFVIFNGENFDYIGSQRFVYELNNKNFPLKDDDVLPRITIDDLQLFVEISQLNDTGKVRAHFLKKNDFLETLSRNSDPLHFKTSADSLPPGSIHTFLLNRTNLQGVLISDHESEYLNPFYNSIYDNSTNLNYVYLSNQSRIQKHIDNVATMLAKSLYEEVSNQNYSGASFQDLEMIDELLHCYLENASCRVHKAIQKKDWYQEALPFYVGVDRSPNVITALVGLTLAWLIGTDIGPSSRCTTDNPAFQFYNMSVSLHDLNNTKCYRATMNFTQAVSPAFIIDDYDWLSGEYSTWTESTWNELTLRVFLKPSAVHENTTIAIGSIVFIVSLLLVYFIKSKADILFTSPVLVATPTNC